MSKASVDLPEPETPVTTLNLLCGMSTEIDFLRLCSRALTIWIDSSASGRAARSGLQTA